jgi:HEAT repeat protein
VRRARLVPLVAVLGLTRFGPSTAAVDPEPEVRDLLGAIDFVPSRVDLDEIVTLQQLIEIATDGQADAGVRIRALRALSLYPSLEASGALTTVIGLLGDHQRGTQVLHLRAAMESLAEIGGVDAVAVITPLLRNPSRDVRATAAHSLRIIGSVTAVPALRAQQAVETVPQVRFAITEAVRALLSG